MPSLLEQADYEYNGKCLSVKLKLVYYFDVFFSEENDLT